MCLHCHTKHPLKVHFLLWYYPTSFPSWCMQRMIIFITAHQGHLRRLFTEGGAPLGGSVFTSGPTWLPWGLKGPHLLLNWKALLYSTAGKLCKSNACPVCSRTQYTQVSHPRILITPKIQQNKVKATTSVPTSRGMNNYIQVYLYQGTPHGR